MYLIRWRVHDSEFLVEWPIHPSCLQERSCIQLGDEEMKYWNTDIIEPPNLPCRYNYPRFHSAFIEILHRIGPLGIIDHN